LKEVIFIGPQIRDIIKSENFDKLLQGEEKAAWDSFKFVVKVFLGIRSAQKYDELVKNLLQIYQNLGSNMSLKIYFLPSHMDFFPENCGVVIDEHGERFYQEISLWRRDIKEMERCYARRLLLDSGKGCPYLGIQATGKM